jgi:hypothetical protein
MGRLDGKVSIVQRSGLPDDIAHAAVFLVSDEATIINGHDLVVDGGVSGGREGRTQEPLAPYVFPRFPLNRIPVGQAIIPPAVTFTREAPCRWTHTPYVWRFERSIAKSRAIRRRAITFLPGPTTRPSASASGGRSWPSCRPRSPHPLPAWGILSPWASHSRGTRWWTSARAERHGYLPRRPSRGAHGPRARRGHDARHACARPPARRAHGPSSGRVRRGPRGEPSAARRRRRPRDLQRRDQPRARQGQGVCRGIPSAEARRPAADRRRRGAPGRPESGALSWKESTS